MTSFHSCFADKESETQERCDFHSEVGKWHGIPSPIPSETPIQPFQECPSDQLLPSRFSLSNKLSFELRTTTPSLPQMGGSHWALQGGYTVSPHDRKIKCLELSPGIEPSRPSSPGRSRLGLQLPIRLRQKSGGAAKERPQLAEPEDHLWPALSGRLWVKRRSEDEAAAVTLR